MMTKTEFFAQLNDPENKITSNPQITLCEEGNGLLVLIVKQDGAPNFWLSNHRAHANAFAASEKYKTWLNEWFAAQAPAAQERIADVNEAHEVAATVEGRRRVAEFFGGMDFAARREAVEAAHAEAIKMDATHDKAVLLVAIHITLPVWERASDALKFQLRKIWGDRAPDYAKEDGGHAHA